YISLIKDRSLSRGDITLRRSKADMGSISFQGSDQGLRFLRRIADLDLRRQGVPRRFSRQPVDTVGDQFLRAELVLRTDDERIGQGILLKHIQRHGRCDSQSLALAN